ncbi:MAG: hypothetical protein Q4C56_00390 [Peptococcaceae bacterium]|nr:hypothetical protein [Peptococcaceae bacterium]
MTTQAKRKTGYVHVAIMFLLTFGTGFLPPVGQITDIGMRVLGVFLGLLYGWIFIDLLWTSIFGFVALGLTGYSTVLASFQGGFGDSNFVLCLIGSIFAGALTAMGVTDTIAYWILSKKIFIGKPWLLIGAICAAAILMGLAQGGFATVFLLWSIVSSICHINGYKKGDRIVSMMIAFVVYFALTAPNVVPFYPGPILYYGFMANTVNVALEVGPFFILGLLYLCLCAVFLVLASKYILRIDASHFTTTEEMCEKYKQHKATKYQKASLILLVVLFAVLLVPEVVTSLPGRDVFRSIGMAGFSTIYMVIFVIWKDDEGQSILNLEKAFSNIPWTTMMLLAVTYPLAAAMESEDIGITATVNQVLVPLMENLDVTVLVILAMLILGTITQFMHNIVMGAIFLPIIAPQVMAMGGSVQVLFMMLYLSLMCAYVTPAGSMMAGLVFGHKEMVRKDAFLFGACFLIVNFLVLLCLMPLGNLLFTS